MGRRRLYHNSEQIQAANRAKSKRSYEKRKERINMLRRAKYAKAQRRLATLQNDCGESSIDTTTEVGTTKPSSPVSIWLERSDRVHRRLQRMTGSNAREYLHCIVEEFLVHYGKDAVYERVVTIGKLQKSMYKYENEVLTLAGMGPDYDKVREITRRVCEVIEWLEEVLCQAMVDATEVEKRFKECRFSFQHMESH